MGKYVFPLAIQLAVPEELHNPGFISLLGALRRHGFHGVELGVRNLEQYSAADYVALLGDFDLKPTMIATGILARERALSLSHSDEQERGRAVSGLIEIMEFAAEMDCGVICGLVKGPAEPGRDGAARHLKGSVRRLAPHASRLRVPLLIEATNRFSALPATILAEAADIVRDLDNPYLRILPDTYHMNMEEADIGHALAAHLSLYRSIHISDNNRFFPGYGLIDFFKILALLKGMGYRGTMAIEGNWRDSPEQDIAFTCAYLQNVSDRISLLK